MPIVRKHHVTGSWLVIKSANTPEKEKEYTDYFKQQGCQYLVVKKIPSLRQLEKWSADGICPTPDGCRVEPDGTCQHGFPSWLMVLGFI